MSDPFLQYFYKKKEETEHDEGFESEHDCFLNCMCVFVCTLPMCTNLDT